MMQLTSQRGRQGKVDDAGGVVAQIDERHQRPTRPAVHCAGVRSAYYFCSRQTYHQTLIGPGSSGT